MLLFKLKEAANTIFAIGFPLTIVFIAGSIIFNKLIKKEEQETYKSEQEYRENQLKKKIRLEKEEHERNKKTYQTTSFPVLEEIKKYYGFSLEDICEIFKDFSSATYIYSERYHRVYELKKFTKNNTNWLILIHGPDEYATPAESLIHNYSPYNTLTNQIVSLLKTVKLEDFKKIVFPLSKLLYIEFVEQIHDIGGIPQSNPTIGLDVALFGPTYAAANFASNQSNVIIRNNSYLKYVFADDCIDVEFTSSCASLSSLKEGIEKDLYAIKNIKVAHHYKGN